MNNSNKQQSASSHPDFFKHLLDGFGPNYSNQGSPKKETKPASKTTSKSPTKKKK